jgi:hypothetical protein
VDQGFAACNGDDRSAAFVDRRETIIEAEAAIKDLLWITDFPAACTGEIAAKQGLQHQHQGIPLPSAHLLPEDVTGNRILLDKRDSH